MALALTCKIFFSTLFPTNKLPWLERDSLATFLCYLEHELGDTHYFCDQCLVLHRFEPSWGPLGNDWFTGCRVNQAALFARSYHLSHHHVRLVMNRHRLAGTAGLPLHVLDQTVDSSWPADPPRLWHRQWSASIIDGELFLRARHTVRGYDEPALRHAYDGEPLQVCEHVCIRGEQGIGRPAPLRPASTYPLAPCQDVPGSCSGCLTDYITTIEYEGGPGGRRRKGGDVAPRYIITVTAYHQVGDGLSPGDWKWRAFVGEWSTCRRNHDPVKYSPGSVMNRWLDASQSGRGSCV